MRRWVFIVLLAIACAGGAVRWAHADPPLGNQNGVCVAGNGNGNQVLGQPCAPTPTPAPSGTAPPLTDTLDWFAFGGVTGNTNPSAALITQYLDWCLGSAKTSGSVAITNCPTSLLYGAPGMGQPNQNGHESNWPYSGAYPADSDRTVGTGTGNCPSPANVSNFWNQQTTWNGATVPDVSSTGVNDWFTFTNGTGSTSVIGNAANLGAGWGTEGNAYRFFTNGNSTTLAVFINSLIQNCMFGGSTGVQTNAMSGVMRDNSFSGLQSKSGSLWDDYPHNKNFGSPTIQAFTTLTGCTTPGASTVADPSFGAVSGKFTPSAFFDGCWHARSTQITATDTPTGTYPQDTSWEGAEAALEQCCTHRDGTPFVFLNNGGNNDRITDVVPTHSIGALMEEYDAGCFGSCNPNATAVGAVSAQTSSALGYPYSARQIVDNIASYYHAVYQSGLNTNVHVATLADIPSTGQYIYGAPSEQQVQRWHFMVPEMALPNDDSKIWVSMVNQCTESSTCVNKYGGNFVVPGTAYQPVPVAPSPLPSPSSSINDCGESTLRPDGSGFNFTGRICGSLGARDPNIGCNGATSGLMCREFAHYYVEQITGSAPCTQFSRANWTASAGACVHDIGPALVIANATNSNTVLSAGNLALWAPHVYSSISAGHLVSYCNDNLSGSFPMYAWTYSGTTYVYAYDVGTTLTAAVAATGSQVASVANTINMYVGGVVRIDTTSTLRENVTITALTPGTPGTFTAVFAHTHLTGALLSAVHSSVCNGTSAQDFNSSGAPASGDAVYHDFPLASVLGDTIAPGTALTIVP